LSAWTRYVDLGRRKQAVRMEYGYDAIARIVAAT
jgi:hypothetical protein